MSRPKTAVRKAAEHLIGDKTMRSTMDLVKAVKVLRAVVPPQSYNGPEAWLEAAQQQWPKFFRGGHLRITVLRHLYPLVHLARRPRRGRWWRSRRRICSR